MIKLTYIGTLISIFLCSALQFLHIEISYIALVACVLILKRQENIYFDETIPTNWMSIIFAMGAGMFSIVLLVNLSDYILESFFTSHTREVIESIQKLNNVSPENSNWMKIVYKVSNALIFAPILEEIVFRRFLIGYFRKHIPLWICVPISIILFCLLHSWQPSHWFSLQAFEIIIEYAPASIVYTIVYMRYGLLASTLLHSFWNSMAAFNNRSEIYLNFVILFSFAAITIYLVRKIIVKIKSKSPSVS